MITVLHVGKFYPPVPGGMEQVLQSICRASGPDVESRVLAFNTTSSTVHDVVDGVRVTRVGTIGTAGSVPIAPLLARELLRVRPDAIVLHEPNPWALLSLALVPPRVPLAIWFHSEVVRPRLQYALFYHPLARTVYGRAERIVVSSPLLGEHAEALAPYRERIRVIPFGIDAARWQPSPAVIARAGEIRAAAGGRALVLFAGRMVPYKGVDVLLRALGGTSAVAILAGDGPSRGEWIELAASLGVSHRVTFPGAVSAEELAALYHACDMFVLPSTTHAEAFGYVQLEAMACAKPIVSTRVRSGVPWVNQDGVTGMTVPPGDAAALGQAIAALAADDGLRRRFGEAGRARVASEFTIAKMGAATTALYHDLASSDRRRRP